MKILIACEESQTVCKAFRELRHEAYSCDIQDCSGGHPEWHFKGYVSDYLYPLDQWNLIIAHPPCTRLCNSGVRWLQERNLWEQMREAADSKRKKTKNVGDGSIKRKNKIKVKNISRYCQSYG